MEKGSFALFIAASFFLLAGTSLFQPAISQNLVPNGDLESFDLCPTGISQLYRATGWYSPTGSSPDYYHRCNNAGNGGNGEVGVPSHQGPGYQEAWQGDAYAGIYLGHWPKSSPNADNYREFLSTRLNVPLQTGRPYRFSMRVALAKRSIFAVDRVGAYFSRDSLFTDPYFYEYIDVTPQVENPAGLILSDTLSWMEVKGTFIADSAYEWLTVGNFRDYENTQSPVIRNYQPSESSLGYYYVDGIGVHAEEPTFDIDIGGDIAICEGEQKELDGGYHPGFNYYWSTGERTRKIKVSSPGTYVIVISNNGFEFAVDTIAVHVIKRPPVQLAENDSVACYGEKLVLEVNELYAESLTWKYLWSDGQTTRVCTTASTGWHTVSVSNECGASTDSLYVRFNACDLYVPNSFTPDGDGLNDEFQPFLPDIPFTAYSLRIYDRWGELIFSTTQRGTAWDGRVNGKPAPMDAYVYQLELTIARNRERQTGTVTLLR